ncbi:MAG: DNA mismatch repair protein MutS [Ruminococcaceae bacterium]|nr:DNA mismatch repair protein MutS [Oscillospiraceae bacterium]
MALTPMMRQYLEFKEQYKDAILFFRLGDFYEMFFEDAKTASRVLNITLTGKDCGEEERAPMCGVPFHAADTYIGKLVNNGFKVVICEQIEDPAIAKGIVKRGVTRIVTPGTVIDGSLLNEGQNNYLCSVYLTENSASLCFADISTGEISATKVETPNHIQKAINELAVYRPKEMILNVKLNTVPVLMDYISIKNDMFVNDAFESFGITECSEIYSRVFGLNISEVSVEDPDIVSATGALLSYINDTQKTDTSNFTSINIYSDGQYLGIDMNTRRNLELCETMRSKEKKGSLLWVLDHAKTAMGKRLLQNWLRLPLVNARKISDRQDAVEELLGDIMLRDDIKEVLKPVLDLERLMARIVYGSANARDLRSLYSTLMQLAPAKELLKGANAKELCGIRDGIDPMSDVIDMIDRAIMEEPPANIREGGFIKDGYNEIVDHCNLLLRNGKEYIKDIENREKEKTGIKNLKVRYNKVFGYYIEVSNSNLSEVPDEYIRKQTLVNGERFITEELKKIESEILGAADKDSAIEYELFQEIREKIADCYQRIQNSAEQLAKLDVYYSLAEAAAANNYVRPEVDYGEEIVIKDGRHPVVEQYMKDSYFVPNDTLLDTNSNKVMLITGPNMAGKSTYMRQVALICIMAQTGSFVPANEARIGIVDKIFTRVGASDDLASGMSTFMLEMNEVAYILKNATKRSLIIYDEIGRGTSTFDGMSIAKAVCEYTAGNKIGAKTLFATHYHELTNLENERSDIKNYNIAAKKKGDDVIFLRKILRGAADDSYGIEVAKLAGLPSEIIKKAKVILESLVSSAPASEHRETVPNNNNGVVAISFADIAEQQLRDKLLEINIDTMSPIEALTFLYELKKLAE